MAIQEYGAPLERIEVPEPEPKPGEALIEVLTCGVCFTDVKTSRGLMPFSGGLVLPHVPGHEICARVLSCDPPLFEPGEMVVVYHLWPCGVCARCRAGIEQQCLNPRGWTGFTSPGGFQERLVVPVDRLTRVPPGIAPVDAASLTCALGTAYRAVVSRGRVAAGSQIVVIGLGGVGIHALQIARAAGARATGIDVSERSLEVARGLGLDVLDARDAGTENLLRRSTGGVGVDVVIDTVGHEDTLPQAMRLTRAGGRVVAVGYALDSKIVLPTARFVLEEIELVGSRYVSRGELDQAIELVAEGQVEMVVDRVLPLAKANKALEALEAGEIVGRTVLTVAGT